MYLSFKISVFVGLLTREKTCNLFASAGPINVPNDITNPMTPETSENDFAAYFQTRKSYVSKKSPEKLSCYQNIVSS